MLLCRTDLTLLLRNLLYAKKIHCEDQVISCVSRENLVMHEAMGSVFFRLDFINSQQFYSASGCAGSDVSVRSDSRSCTSL